MGCVIQFLKECRTSALISPPVPARDVLPKSSIKASTTLTASLEAVPAAARPKWLLALRSLFFSASLSEIFLPLAMWSTACPTWKMSVITSGWNGSITCFDDVSSGKKNKLILLSLIFFPDFMSRIWEQTYGLQAVHTMPEVACFWEVDGIWSFWKKIQGKGFLDYPSMLV